MEDKILSARTEITFLLLTFEDPKYPKQDFLLKLREKTHHFLHSFSQDTSEDNIFRIIKQAVSEFVVSNDDKWEEITNSYYSSDLHEILAIYVEKIVRRG